MKETRDTDLMPDILIPEPGDPYEPVLARGLMSTAQFLKFGEDEERWELIYGLPALPERKSHGTLRLEGHLRRLLHDRVPASLNVWGPGALVLIDDETVLSPSVLAEPRSSDIREVLICDPVLIIEASFGGARDRAILHDRRARFLARDRVSPIVEYLAVIDSGPVNSNDTEGVGDDGLWNFVPGTGRRWAPASRSRRVYRFDRAGNVERFSGSDLVHLISIDQTIPVSELFPDVGVQIE